MSKLAIDQSGERANACRVMVTMMTISVRKGLITTHPTNTVLHDNSSRGEGRVVGHSVGWPGLPRRFATGRCACAELIDTHISPIPDSAHPVGQTAHQGRLLQQADVSRWPGHTLGDIHDTARFFIDSHLAFECRGFLLPQFRLSAWVLSRGR
jgi:hypothetical protein